jgi:hypothetical protein
MSTGSPYLLDRRISTTPPDNAGLPYDRVEENRIFEEQAVAANLSVQGVKLSAWADRVVALEGGAGVGVGLVRDYDTRADAIAATISVQVDIIRTGGYATAGDGGHGLYKRLGAEPSGSSNTAYFESADGTWWQLVPQGNEVHIAQFGGFADFDGSTPGTATDLYAPINYAMDFIAYTESAVENWPYRIRLGYGKYYSSTMWEIHTHAHIVGENLEENDCTEVYWPSTTTCIAILQNNHDGESGVTGVGQGAGNGATLQGFTIRHHYAVGSFSHLVYSAAHGIHSRTLCRLHNMTLARIAGHAILIHGASGHGTPSEEGSPNQWRIRDCAVHSCGGHSLAVYGADGNAGSCIGFSNHTEVGGCGIYDNSSFNNDYASIHISGYGNRGVHYAGRRYILISGTPLDNPTTIGRTTTPGTNNLVWYDIGPGSVSNPTWAEWDSVAGDYTMYRLPIWDGGGARTYTGVYVETSNAVAHVLPSSIIVGGTVAVTNYSLGYMASLESGIQSRGGFGGRYVPIDSSAEYTRNGINTWVSCGTPHESAGMGASGGIQFLTYRRVSDGDSSWTWGYKGDDIIYATPYGRNLWKTTTGATAFTFGRSTTQLGYNMYVDPIIVNNADETLSRVWTSTAVVAPASENHAKGEMAWHTNKVGGEYAASFCSVTGTPGTWLPAAPIAADTAGHLRDHGLKKCGTNDVNNSTTLVAIVGHSDDLTLGQYYTFRVVLSATCNVAGGIKVAMGGTATATIIRYDVLIYDAGVLAAQGRGAALGDAVGVTAVTAPYIVVEGVIYSVTGAGTLTVTFAQNAAHASNTTVLAGSTLQVTNMA